MIAEDPSPQPSLADAGDKGVRPVPARRYVWLGGVVVFVVFGTLVQARLWKPDTVFTIRTNVQIAEAKAWWNGRLDVPERRHDTALKDGRAYSYFPP